MTVLLFDFFLAVAVTLAVSAVIALPTNVLSGGQQEPRARYEIAWALFTS